MLLIIEDKKFTYTKIQKNVNKQTSDRPQQKMQKH